MGVLRKRLEILKNDERYCDTKSGIVGPTGIVPYTIVRRTTFFELIGGIRRSWVEPESHTIW